MKTVTIGEFKTNLSAYAEQIKNGEEFVVTHGRRKKKIFRVLPFKDSKSKKRRLGILNGKVKVVMNLKAAFMPDSFRLCSDMVGILMV